MLVVAVLGVIGIVSFYAYSITLVTGQIKDMESGGYTFGQQPPKLSFVKSFEGEVVDWGWGRTKIPGTSEVIVKNPINYLVSFENDEMNVAFMYISECDKKRLTHFFGEEVYSSDYEPSLHTREFIEYLKNSSMGGSGKLLHCSYSWWLYGQSLEKYDFWELFWGGAEVANPYMVKMMVLVMFYKDMFTFETANLKSKIQLLNKNRALCAIWNENESLYVEFNVGVKDGQDVKKVAQQIIANFEFPLKRIPNENELEKIVKKKLEANKRLQEDTQTRVPAVGRP